MYTAIVFLPLLGFLIAGFVGNRIGPRPTEIITTGLLMVSALLAAFGVSLAPRLLALMGANPDLVATATPYMRVMFSGNAAILLLFLGNAVVRGAGDGTIAMRSLWIANGINLILAPCFVYGLLFFPKLGVTGAACATTTARGIGAIYTLSHLFRGPGRVKVHKRHLTFLPDLMARVVKLSATGTFQIFISTASWVGMVRVISRFGADAVAGYTIGIRVMLFAIFPAFGLSNAAATMVGQSLGAGKPERAEKAVWLAGFYNLAFLGTMGILFLAFAPLITGWFTTDPVVHDYATACLRTVSCGFLFYAFGMVLTQSFNGAGDTWTPTWINLFVFWILEIPLAYGLSSHLKMGPQGVFLAVTIAFSTLAVVSAVLFRRGGWKTKKV
jgi:putative MATE family efflux protein